MCESSEVLFIQIHLIASPNVFSQLNVNATICPFELMGRCEDSDCSYMHLTPRASSPEAIDPVAVTVDAVVDGDVDVAAAAVASALEQ